MKGPKISRGLKITVYIVFIISAFLFFVSLAGIFLDSSLDAKRFYASVLVGGRGGFDLNDSALTFGMIMPGGSSTRSVSIENNYDFDIVVYIEIEGSISNLLSYEQNVVIVPGEKKDIGISVGVPSDFEYGFYDGEVLYSIRKRH